MGANVVTVETSSRVGWSGQDERAFKHTRKQSTSAVFRFMDIV